MDVERRCRLLLGFREEGIRFWPFVGARWLILKAILLTLSLVIVWSPDPFTRTAGLIVLGYALGTIAAGTRSYVVAKRLWPLQKELLDWAKVEACAKESSP